MANHDAIIEIEEDTTPAVGSGAARLQDAIANGPVDAIANARLQDDQVARCLKDIRGELEKSEMGRSFQAQASSCTIFRIPEVLREINAEAVKPELVSIGPYHTREERLPEFEGYKWFFLKSFLRRTGSDLERLFKLVADQASSALGCYFNPKITLNEDSVKMMLLDGCFVVELLLQICGEEDARAPILRRQSIIPILIRDLLKLENQLPYSLLQSLFEYSSSARIEARTPYLSMLALRVFNLAYSGATELPESEKYTDLQYQHYDVIKERPYDHLLDVIYSTFFLAKDLNKDVDDAPRFRPRDKAIPTVTQLKPCGIKFKSKKTERFLDISFRKRVLDGVLEIPSIAVNDFMVTVLINCIALEQGPESIAVEQGPEGSSKHKHITDYVSFMHCLINQPKDVSLLCSDRIISTLSHDDQYVVNLFNGLGKRIVFNVNNCYLSKEFEELDSYYYSSRASFIRTYFSSPWALIAAFSALLGIALTVTQTVFAVLGHHFR